MNLMACRTAGRLRFMVPTCTILLYLRAASTIFRPSHTVWEAGFSTYTCLPAWRAQMVASACQWLGVATITPSMSLSSRTRRRSCSVPGLKVGDVGQAAIVHAAREEVRVDVAQRLDLDVLEAGEAALQRVALAADADAGQHHAVVGAQHAAARHRSRPR